MTDKEILEYIVKATGRKNRIISTCSNWLAIEFKNENCGWIINKKRYRNDKVIGKFASVEQQKKYLDKRIKAMRSIWGLK